MNKKLEVIVIENDELIVHRSVSEVYPDTNLYNAVIQSMVNHLTEFKAPPDKVSPPIVRKTLPPISTQLELPMDNEFHPDLVSQGIAPKKIPERKFNITELAPIKMSDVFSKDKGVAN